MSTVDDSENASVRVYRRIAPATAGQLGQILANFRVALPDRPGSLAGFASTIARSG